MNYSLNSTKAYHTDRLSTLGWELTVCNALYPEKTPIRKVLARNDSYGHLLYDHLDQFLSMKDVKKVIEIGGGYGYLMKDFLDRNSSLEPCMLDVSPYLLEKQKETLKDYYIMYREEDFIDTDSSLLAGFDLAIVNENLGDFPTLLNLGPELFYPSYTIDDPYVKETLRFFETYTCNRPESDLFHFNLGALQAVEKLCGSGIPYIYLGEHSCEATVPETLELPIHIESSGMPERISLTGHDEYSIKFSYLQRIGETLGYTFFRGPFADFIPFTVTEQVRHALVSQGRENDDDEIVCQFIEDLYKYEYLIFIRKNIQ